MFKDERRPPLSTGIPKESHQVTHEDAKLAVEQLLHPELVVSAQGDSWKDALERTCCVCTARDLSRSGVVHRRGVVVVDRLGRIIRHNCTGICSPAILFM